MQALSIVGYKNSGKTTLARELVRTLTARGRKVAAAKFSHSPLDKEGTDTAGLLGESRVVFGLGKGETAVFWPEEKNLLSLLPLTKADFLVVEGGKSLDWLPRVILPKNADEAGELDRGLALAAYGEIEVPGMKTINDIEALADLALNRGFVLAGLDCHGCGKKNCAGLAQDIVQGQAGPEQCVALHSEITVKLNGNTLPMNPFVARIMGAGIKAMLGELKGIAPGQAEITLEI